VKPRDLFNHMEYIVLPIKELQACHADEMPKWSIMPWAISGKAFCKILTPQAIDILLLTQPIVFDRNDNVLAGFRSLEIVKAFYSTNEKPISIPIIKIKKRLSAADRYQLSAGMAFVTILSSALNTKTAYFLGDFWQQMRDKPALLTLLAISKKSNRGLVEASGLKYGFIFRRKKRGTK